MKVHYQVNSDSKDLSLFFVSVAFLVSFLFFPPIAFSAQNDAILQSGTEIVANGETVTVSESGVESLTVNAGDFTADMPPGAGLRIVSANRRTFTVSPTSRVESFDCGSSASTLVVVGPPAGSDTVTVTITPASSGTCSTGGGGISGAGGVGGGGVSIAVAPTVTTVPAAVVAKPSVVAKAVSPVFTGTLVRGISNADVKRLQQLLNSDPDTRIAVSGVGSPGNETEFFGSLTEAAVKKFQVKYGVAGPGDAGYGVVGPKTRAKLAEVFAAEVTPLVPPAVAPAAPAAAVSPVFASGMGRGISGADIKRLQQLLNSDTDTRVASSGVGSPGNETEFFGSLTETAVKKFQVKYGVAGPGDLGYGYVGPKTRAKLEEVFGAGVPAQTPAAALQKQIEDALKQVQELQAQLQSLLN